MGMETTTNPTNTPDTFVVGTTYTTGEARDYVWRFLVVARTAKTITIDQVVNGTPEGKPTRRKVTPFMRTTNVESVLPLGTYSMAPVLTADDVFAG